MLFDHAPHYEWILFDADGTLFDFNQAERNALSLAFTDCKVPYSEKELLLYHEINDHLWKELEKGTVTREQLPLCRFLKLTEQIGASVDIARELSRLYPAYLRQQSILYPGVLALCRALSERFSLAVITNGYASTQHGRFDHAEIRPYLQDVFISEELGVCKPQKEYFDIVLRRLHITDRAKVLVVGDSLSSDMKGGYCSGLDTCWYHPDKSKASFPDFPITYEISDLSLLYQLP